MIITKPHSKDGGIEGIFRGHWFQAQVSDEPSLFGIEGSRTHKLTVARGPSIPEAIVPALVGYQYDGECLICDEDYRGIVGALVLELDKLPILSKPKPTPTVAELAMWALKKSPFQGLYSDDGCFCYDEDLLTCKKFIACEPIDCHAGYKHKSRLDGITIKPYPPENGVTR